MVAGASGRATNYGWDSRQYPKGEFLLLSLSDTRVHQTPGEVEYRQESVFDGTLKSLMVQIIWSRCEK